MMNYTGKTLKLVNRGVTDMDNLGINKALVNLDLRLNQISKITGLVACINLTSLDLSKNDVSKISGLEYLVCLQILNLSFNKIEVVENLSSLPNLVTCNLSCNKIKNLTGFKELTSPNYKLEFLDISGNAVDNIDHLLSCLKPCQSIHHLILSICKFDNKKSMLFSSTDEESHSVKELGEQINKYLDNPICSISGYKHYIFKSLISLVSLDGINREGQSVDLKLKYHGLAGQTNQLLITTSESSDLDKFLSKILLDNEKTGISKTDDFLKDAQSQKSLQESKLQNHSDFDKNVLTKIAEDLGDKFLKIIDEKLTRNKKVDMEHPSRIPILKTSALEQTTKLNPDKGGLATKKVKPSTHVKQYNFITDGESDEDTKNSIRIKGKNDMTTMEAVVANFSRLTQNLNEEKELRWKAEKSIADLNRRLKEEIEEKNDLLKKVDIMKKSQVARGQNSNEIKNLLSDLDSEKEKNSNLLEKFDVLEKSTFSLQTSFADLEKTKIKIEDKLRKAEEISFFLKKAKEQEEKNFNLKNQEQLAKIIILKKELEIWKNKNENLKRKIMEQQTLTMLKEKELEGKSTRQDQEMENYIQSRIDAVREPLEGKIRELKKAYADLEDEFREALRSEFSRFEKVKEAFLSSEETLKECKQEGEDMKESYKKNVKRLAELNGLVKEQKVKLTELSSSKKEQEEEFKLCIKTMEGELKDLRVENGDVSRLQKERSILRARIESLESLVLGLKSEKRIWGEELAQQSSSLAQEKGRLELRIESLEMQLSSAQDQLSKELDQGKINFKIISDQSESIKKLKEMLAEKDELLKNKNGKIFEVESDAKKRLEKMSEEFADLVEELERCTNRKNEIKDRLNVANKKLQEKEEECRRMKDEWKRMSEEIKVVEDKVTKVTDQKIEHERQLEEAKQSLLKQQEAELQEIREEYQKQLVFMETDSQVRLKMADQKIKEVEEEMRDLLREREKEKAKMATVSRMFQELSGKIQ